MPPVGLWYAFDLNLRGLPFLDRKAALARLLRDTKAGILLNEHIAENGPTVFAHACRLGRVKDRLDQGPQSRKHRGKAGAERELEKRWK